MKERSFERIMFYGAEPYIFARAKALRQNMTPAEVKLWDRLKNNQLGGFRFKAQHPVYKFIVDFYSHKARLVVEVDGEIHKNSVEYDQNRTTELEKYELKIIRFTNQEIETNIEDVVKRIRECLPTPPAP
jgi:very-short-patch-repair endonuclease